MEFEFIILLCIILFFASLVHGSIGFGFPIISTPLIALSTDMQTAIIYTLIPTLLVNIISIKSEGTITEAFKKFWLLALYTSIGSAVGTLLLIYFHSDIFKLLLALMILFYLALGFIKFEMSWVKQKARLSQSFFGIVSGVLGGLTNAMSPILIIYTLESKFSKKEVIQAFNVCFLTGKIIQISIFCLSSAFTFKEFSISSFSIIFVLIAFILGMKLKKLINAELYKKIIKVILFIIAMMLLWQSV